MDTGGDSAVEVSVAPGQRYTVDVRAAKHDISPIDLRQLPAMPSQRARVLLAAERRNHTNRFFGPTSGARVVLKAGAAHDIIDTYGGDDALNVGSGNNVIRTRGGDDFVGALGGHDRVWTGPGDDHAWMGRGNHVIFLGPGTNHAVGGRDRDIIRGGPGRDLVQNSGIINARTFGGVDEIDISGASGAGSTTAALEMTGVITSRPAASLVAVSDMPAANRRTSR